MIVRQLIYYIGFVTYASTHHEATTAVCYWMTHYNVNTSAARTQIRVLLIWCKSDKYTQKSLRSAWGLQVACTSFSVARAPRPRTHDQIAQSENQHANICLSRFAAHMASLRILEFSRGHNKYRLCTAVAYDLSVPNLNIST